MTISKIIRDFLEKKDVEYEHLQHPLTYTASETASSQHVPGKQFMKTVIVKKDKDFLMCTLPSMNLVDFDKLKAITNSENLELASEEDLKGLFPDYDLGAEPPFWGDMPIYCDATLEGNEYVYFNAGTHVDIIKLKMEDYKRFANPKICDLQTSDE